MPKKSRFRPRFRHHRSPKLLYPDKRGLLASRQLEGQPVQGVYFFAGETWTTGTYTAHPLDIRDQHWNSDSNTHAWVIDRMLKGHVNTIVMSYWRELFGSPMNVDSHTLPALLEAVQGKPMVIMPAIEGGSFYPAPDSPTWEFQTDFPTPDVAGLHPAHGLLSRIGDLKELFKGRMNLWAKLYDRNGRPRYAVNIIQTCSWRLDPADPASDEKFAGGFAAIADKVKELHHIDIGFTLDAVSKDGCYSATPDKAGSVLERTASVLAIQGWASEVFSRLIKPGSGPTKDWRTSTPHDNNADNIDNLINWKRGALQAWVQTGVPVIFDVSCGYDGRIVFADKGYNGFWGDNLQYTDDRWRNALSMIKGPGIRGITFNSWNGYTEGMAGVPTKEHGQTVYNWLKDTFEPPPWDYSHMHYVNGAATHRVYGAICEKWLALGGDTGFGAPVGEELPAGNGRKQEFADGKSIYWSPATGAHEIHGLIRITYIKNDAEAGFLGFPVLDEAKRADGRVSTFEHGEIVWKQGETEATAILFLAPPIMPVP